MSSDPAQDHGGREPWIKIRVSLRSHHKLPKIRAALSLASRREAMGLVVDLWLATFLNCWRDGDWTPWGVEGFEEEMGWTGERVLLVATLKRDDIKVLDAGEGIVVHGWKEVQSRLIKERVRERYPTRGGTPGMPDENTVDAAAAADAKRRAKSKAAKEAA